MNIRIRKGNRFFAFKKDPSPYFSLPNNTLFLAIMHGDMDIFKQLFENSEEKKHEALWIAVAYRQIKITEHLLKLGTSPDLPSPFCLRLSHPLQIAVAVPDNYDCILLLLRHHANIFIKTIEGKPLWEIAADYINHDLINAYIHLNKAIEEFSSNMPYANLAFASALFLDPKLVFNCLADMVEASNAVETGACETHPAYHPDFLCFAIRQLKLMVETKPEQFENGWLSDEFKQLSFHLNAYDTSHASDNPYALFRNTKEKMKMLYYFEKGTELGNSKNKFMDKFEPPQ